MAIARSDLSKYELSYHIVNDLIKELSARNFHVVGHIAGPTYAIITFANQGILFLNDGMANFELNIDVCSIDYTEHLHAGSIKQTVDSLIDEYCCTFFDADHQKLGGTQRSEESKVIYDVAHDTVRLSRGTEEMTFSQCSEFGNYVLKIHNATAPFCVSDLRDVARYINKLYGCNVLFHFPGKVFDPAIVEMLYKKHKFLLRLDNYFSFDLD